MAAVVVVIWLVGTWVTKYSLEQMAFYAPIAVLVVYAYLNVERTVDIWGDGSDSKRMSAFFIYGFAAAKLSLTCLFAYVVVRHANATKSDSAPATAGP